MKNFLIIVIILITFIPPALLAKDAIPREQLWLGYSSHARISKRFGIRVDLHYRTTDRFIQNKFQFISHFGLTYFLSENVRFTAGYVYSYQYADAVLHTPGRPEHRPWQQLWWRQTYHQFQTIQSLRFEQRYRSRIDKGQIAEGYNFNYRIRYNFALLIPLTGKKIEAKTLFFSAADEIFINLGKEVITNYFDSNRFFVGFGYQFTKNLTTQLGYMNLFQPQVGNKYILSHIIRFNILQIIDFRKEPN